MLFYITNSTLAIAPKGGPYNETFYRKCIIRDEGWLQAQLGRDTKHDLRLICRRSQLEALLSGVHVVSFSGEDISALIYNNSLDQIAGEFPDLVLEK